MTCEHTSVKQCICPPQLAQIVAPYSQPAPIIIYGQQQPKSPTIFGNIIVAVGTISAAIIAGVFGLYAHQAQDSKISSTSQCKDAAAHDQAIQTLANIDDRRKGLAAHIDRFHDCAFATLARSKLDELNRAASSSRLTYRLPGTMPVDAPTREDVAPPVQNRDEMATLPPVMVTRQSSAVITVAVGDRYLIPNDAVYRINPPFNVTTSFAVERGEIALYVDGKLSLRTADTFRTFTRGFSEYRILALTTSAIVRAKSAANGDQIQNELPSSIGTTAKPRTQRHQPAAPRENPERKLFDIGREPRARRAKAGLNRRRHSDHA